MKKQNYLIQKSCSTCVFERGATIKCTYCKHNRKKVVDNWKIKPSLKK